MESEEFKRSLKRLKEERELKIREIKNSFEQKLYELNFDKKCEENIKEGISKKMRYLKQKEIEVIDAINKKIQENKFFIPEEYINSIRDNQNEFISLREDFIDLVFRSYSSFRYAYNCEDDTTRNSTEINSTSSGSTSNYSINSISTRESLEEDYDFIGLSINPVHHNNCG